MISSISSNIYASYVAILTWGGQGTGKGQFQWPAGVAVDSSGNVFVADTFNDRIQKFQLANPCPSGTTQIVPGVCFIKEWGSYGTGKGQFNVPFRVTVDSSGNLFVTDSQSDRIQKFQLANFCPHFISTQIVPGVCFIKEWGSRGAGKGQFWGPFGVAVDSSGNVFVTDAHNHRIQKFQLANACPSGTAQIVPGVCFIKEWGGLGTGKGQFQWPAGVAVDSSGNVFVADTFNDRIQKFQLASRCSHFISTQIVPGVCFIKEWGGQGTSKGQFDNPYGVAVDSSGNVFVADTYNHRIQKFQLANACPSGTAQIVPGVCFIKEWGGLGTSKGQFNLPVGVAVDSSGRVYVADFANHRIQIFTDKFTDKFPD